MARAKRLVDPTPQPIRRDNLTLGVALSIALHAAVLGAFKLSWPYFRHETPLQPPLIVDLVPISDITAAPPKAEPQEAPTPTPETQPEPPKPAEEQKPAEEPTPKPEPAPPPPPPQKPEPVAPPAPKVPPPPPKPQPPKPKKDDMAQLEQLLKNMEKQQSQKPQGQTKPQAPEDVGSHNDVPNVSDRATMTELDAIRQKFESCWSIDPGEQGIENLSAEIRVFISTDGTVQHADILDTARYFADPQFRTFANRARIAVLSCKGIPISPDHYNELKDMVLNFSPQGLIN